MLRVSTTTLEQFRRVMTLDYASEYELIEQIEGRPFKPTWQMQAGTAWHTAIADRRIAPSAVDPETEIEVGEFKFRYGAIQAARDLFGWGVWEVKATRDWMVEGRPVRVVAQADHVRGLLITDAKVKFSPPDVKDYDSDLQWRFYLAVHQGVAFRYVLFSFTEPYGGLCSLKDIVQARFFPYSALEAECQEWVGRFVEWAGSRNLLRCLDREGRTLTAEVL